MSFCQGFEEKIFDHVEGLLPHEFRQEVNEHFQSCHRCSNIYSTLLGVKTQLRSLKPVKTSADFETVLRTRIRMERSLSRRSFFAKPIGIQIYAATGAFIVLAAFFFLGSWTNPFRQSDSIPPISTNQTLSQRKFTPLGSSDSRDSRQPQVHYPIDWMHGTPISSSELEKHSSARDDSVRKGNLREVRHLLEF